MKIEYIDGELRIWYDDGMVISSSSDGGIYFALQFREEIPAELVAYNVAYNDTKIEKDWEEGWLIYGFAYIAIYELQVYNNMLHL